MRKHILFIFLFVLGCLRISSPAAAASPARAMKEGIRAYEAEKYDEALSRFEEAEVEAPDDPKVRYNAANARYRTGDFESAAKEFEQVLSKTDDPELQEKAYYNLGNAAFRKGDLKASSDFYRKALSIAPEDRQAKENLEFVLKALEEQKQKEQQQPQKGESLENQKDTSLSEQRQDRKQEGAPQDQPAAKPQPRKQQAKEETQSPALKDGEEKEPSEPTTGKEDEQKQPEGPIREAGGKRKEEETEPNADTRQNHAVEGRPLSPDEAERLLNSLSDDQRAYFREQAARQAPKKKSVVIDW